MAGTKKSTTKREVKTTPKDAIEDSTKVKVTIEVDGEEVARFSMDRKGPDNPFNSGSVGFYSGGKVSIDAYNHQLSMSLVQIGTKGGGE